MKMRAAGFLSLGVVALASAFTSPASLVSASSVPPGGDEPMMTLPPISDAAPGCAEITTLINAQDSLIIAYLSEDASGLPQVLETLQADADAAVAAAPPEITDIVTTWVSPIPAFLAALEGVDVTDMAAVGVALEGTEADDDAQTEADAALRDWASEACGFTSFGEQLQAGFETPPDPPSCDVIDASVAAEAAGLDVDVSDGDGTATFGLPGYSTSSCSYGDGALTISTISYNSVDQAVQFFVDNITDGEFLEVALGSLPPDTTLVTTQSGLLSVTVLDATLPFSVGFPADSVTPEAAVAAAEAVYASLPDVPPMTSDAP